MYPLLSDGGYSRSGPYGQVSILVHMMLLLELELLLFLFLLMMMQADNLIAIFS